MTERQLETLKNGIEEYLIFSTKKNELESVVKYLVETYIASFPDGECSSEAIEIIEKSRREFFETNKQKAEQGDADAQYKLGWCYYQGNGVEQNYAKALEWYKKSADQGNAYALSDIGKMYEKGHGVAQNYAKAVELYTKAAEQGYAEAQYNLDHSKQKTILRRYKKASEQGFSEAVEALKEIEENILYDDDGL